MRHESETGDMCLEWGWGGLSDSRGWGRLEGEAAARVWGEIRDAPAVNEMIMDITINYTQ